MNKRSKRLTLMLFVSMILVSILAPIVKASPITIEFDPTTGPVGTPVTVWGTADTLNGQVEIYWDLPGNVLNTTTAVDYNYSVTITIPEAVAGTHAIGAKDVAAKKTSAKVFSVESSIALSQYEGPIGTEVTVSGTGFATVSSINVTWDNETVLTTDSNENGSFTGNFTVTPSVAGDHNVTATDGDGNTDSAPFTVWGITISISPTSGCIGTIVTVNGTYATPEGNVTIIWDSVPVDNATAQTDGTYSYNLTVPPSGAGAHVITALDVASTNNASETFTVLPIEISIDPDSGPVETEVTVSGLCATPEGDVAILWDGVEVDRATTLTDGTYSYLLTVPPSVNGEHTITAVDLASTNNASDTFTVVALITLDPEDGLVGDIVLVSGTGFSGNSEVDVYFDVDLDGVPDPEELLLDDVPTNETGSFESNFTVSWVSTAGNYLVTAIDAEGVTDEATFTVLFVMYTRSSEYFQGDYPSFFIQAVDEDGEPLEDVGVIVGIFDPDGYLHYKGITGTTPDGTVPYDMQFFSWVVWYLTGGEVFELSPFHLPSDAPIGTWTWTAIAYHYLGGLTVSESFEVVESVDLRTLLEKLDELLEGQDDIAGLIAYYGDKLQLEHEDLIVLIESVAEKLQMDHKELADLVTKVFNELGIKLDDIKTEIIRIEEKVDGLYLVIGDLELKLDDIQPKLDSIQGNIATIVTDIGTIKTDISNINAEIVAIEGRLATIETDVGTIQTDLSAINAKITSIEGSLAAIETDIGIIKVDISNINGKIVAIEGNVATIQTDIGSVKTSLTDINAKISVINDNIATIQTDIGEIEVKLDDTMIPLLKAINATIVSFEEKVDGYYLAINTTIGEIVLKVDPGVFVYLEAIEAKLDAIGPGVVRIESALGDIELKLDETVIPFLQAIEAKLDFINATTLRIESAIGEVEVKLDDIGDFLVDIKAEIVDIEEKIDGVYLALNTTLGKIEVKLDYINATLTSIEGRLATIESDIGSIKVDIAAINGTLTAIEGRLATIETDIGTIQVDIASIDTTITSIEGNIVTITTKLGTIEGRITTIEGDIATIKTDIGEIQVDLPPLKETSSAIQSTTTLGMSIGSVLSAVAAIAAVAACILIFRRLKVAS